MTKIDDDRPSYPSLEDILKVVLNSLGIKLSVQDQIIMDSSSRSEGAIQKTLERFFKDNHLSEGKDKVKASKKIDLSKEFIDYSFKSFLLDNEIIPEDFLEEIDDFINRRYSLTLRTKVFEASQNKVNWEFITKLCVPWLAICFAEYTQRGYVFDKGMTGSKFWYIADKKDRNSSVDLPLKKLFAWWKESLGLKSFRSLYDFLKELSSDNEKFPAYKTFDNWLFSSSNTKYLPSLEIIKNLSKLSAEIEERNYLSIKEGVPLLECWKIVSSYIDKKELDSQKISEEIPMNKEDIDKVIEVDPLIKDKELIGCVHDFVELMHNRYSRPSVKEMENRLKVARSSQYAFIKLSDLFGEENAIEVCHSFCRLYNDFLGIISQEEFDGKNEKFKYETSGKVIEYINTTPDLTSLQRWLLYGCDPSDENIIYADVNYELKNNNEISEFPFRKCDDIGIPTKEEVSRNHDVVRPPSIYKIKEKKSHDDITVEWHSVSPFIKKESHSSVCIKLARRINDEELFDEKWESRFLELIDNIKKFSLKEESFIVDCIYAEYLCNPRRDKKEGDKQKILESLDRLEELSPYNLTYDYLIWLIKGRFHAQDGDFLKAATFYLKALDSSKNRDGQCFLSAIHEGLMSSVEDKKKFTLFFRELCFLLGPAKEPGALLGGFFNPEEKETVMIDLLDISGWFFGNGFKENFVKRVFEDGSTYLGRVDSKKKFYGTGVMERSNGVIYTGNWRDGKRCGRGKETLPDGNFFWGIWKDDKPLRKF
jgi:hypothetical protein